MSSPWGGVTGAGVRYSGYDRLIENLPGKLDCGDTLRRWLRRFTFGLGFQEKR